MERLLYRLSASRHRDQFLLKGAPLIDLWFQEPHRPTQDVDFLGIGSDYFTLTITFPFALPVST
ncbi:MAG: nucleotidyl transferase AbiEii/AbiGii toxin family protein [Gammaproteobacteria bacterium]